MLKNVAPHGVRRLQRLCARSFPSLFLIMTVVVGVGLPLAFQWFPEAAAQQAESTGDREASSVTTPPTAGAVDFETPRLDDGERQVISPYTFAGVKFTTESASFTDAVVGLVKNRATSACVDPSDENQKLGTGRSAFRDGSIGFSGFPIKAEFGNALDATTAPVFVSVELQALAGTQLRLRLFDTDGTEVHSTVQRAEPAAGTCGYPGTARARTSVRVESSKSVGAVVVDVLESHVFVIDNFSFGTVSPRGAPMADISERSVAFGDVDVGAAVDRTVTVRNSGTEELAVYSVEITGDEEHFSLNADGCSGRRLAASTSCSITVVFRPRSAGTMSTALRITDNAGDSPQTVVLTGQATPPPGQPAVALDPEIVDFGSWQAGESTGRAVRVASVGTKAVAIASIAIEGSNAANFAIVEDGCSHKRLDPKSSCSVHIEFRAGTPGSRSATLTVTHNAPDSPSSAILQGQGGSIPPGRPRVTLLPAASDFGNVVIGHTARRSVSVRNEGDANLQVYDVVVTGGHGADFSKRTDNCVTRSVRPGTHCTVEIEFHPREAGSRRAALLVAHNAPGDANAVSLVGEATAARNSPPPLRHPKLVVSPTAVDFGEIESSGTTIRAVTVRNVGTAPLAITSVRTGGSNPGDFAAVDDRCSGTQLEPNSTCTIELRFLPSDSGTRRATLLISHDASQADDTVVLHGTRSNLPPTSRSGFSRSVPTPNEVSLDPRSLVSHGLGAVLLLLLVAFPAELFNKTLQENYDVIRRWWMRPASPPPGRLTSSGLRLVLFASIGAILYSLVDPGLTADAGGLALVVGLFVAILVTTITSELPTAVYLRRIYRQWGVLRLYPAAFAVAAPLVVLSRLAHFLPGYVFGLIAGYALSREEPLPRQQEGRSLAVKSVALLLTSMAAWGAWAPVKAAAEASNPSLLLLLADNALCAIFVIGIEVLLFGLMPLQFLDGRKLKEWNPLVWGFLYGAVLFTFLHVLVYPPLDQIDKPSGASPTSVLVLFVVFGALSIAVWGYFRQHRRREEALV